MYLEDAAWWCVWSWLCGARALSYGEDDKVSTSLLSGLKPVDGQIIFVVWLWWGFSLPEGCTVEVTARQALHGEVWWMVVKFSALQAGVQASCTCTSVSRGKLPAGRRR